MRKLPTHELPVIPTANLVDIAILLIIFYMACSNFVSKTSAKVTQPKAPHLTTFSEPLVMVAIDSAGTIYLQGREVEGAEAVESGVGNLIRNKKTDEGRTVMLKCDAAVGREVFEPVLDAIVQAGGLILAAGDNLSAP